MKVFSTAVCNLMLFASAPVFATTTFNAGWHNPPVSTWGINALWMGPTWGFEIGVGQVEASGSSSDNDEDDDSASLAIGGGLNGKYFFAGGRARPYAQLGIGLGFNGTVGDNGGAGAGAGGVYGGLGIMMGSESFYGYGSVNAASNEHVFGQIGMGFGI